MTDSETTILWAAIAFVAIAIASAATIITSRRRARVRSAGLRQRFGPEYERAVQELGSPARAERELAKRTKRVDHIQFHELSSADRARFSSTWRQVQAQFVDDPTAAVVGANELIKDVMRARGYKIDNFDQRVADLSVDHPAVVQHYRAAHALMDPTGNQPVNTEELRQAVVHYRALFADLLQERSPIAPQQHRDAHA
jgi:hypothetical protein